MAGVSVVLLSSPGERNVEYRSYETIATCSCEITEPFNIETPEILIDRNDDYLSCDYVYIEKFGRYYFRNDIKIENGNQFRFILESDPLMSFRSDIDKSQVVAKRSSSHPNGQIRDDLIVLKNIPKRSTRTFGTGFSPDGNGDCYILTLGGK